MRKKEKEIVRDLLENEFALIVCLMRAMVELDTEIGPDKVDELFSEVCPIVDNLTESALKAWKIV
jgi:hypothetical protein